MQNRNLSKDVVHLLIVMIALICLAAVIIPGQGCSLYRESLVEMSREDVKNAEAVKEAAINFNSTWLLNSGFIRGVLGIRVVEFPVQFTQALDELDELALKEELTDFALGYSLGLRIRTLETLIQDALKIYAPDILNYLPFPLKF